MNPLQIVVEAFRSMMANRLRTLLTMLGIIIGITSVVLLLAVGDSMKRFIAKELEQLGTNMLFVSPGGDRAQQQRMRSGAAPSLTMQRCRSAQRAAVAGRRGAGAAGRLQSRGGQRERLEDGARRDAGHVQDPRLEDRQGQRLQRSRRARRRAHGGHRPKIADQFFYKIDPLGKYIRIENVSFQVVGVLYGEGKQVDGGDLADYVLVPITASPPTWCGSRSPAMCITWSAQGKSGGNLHDAIQDISETLRDRHHIKFEQPDDFRIDNLASFAETANKISAGLAALLGLIGAISLVVGGIGIMNIMLVSVTERTREIGIRMAIGAKPRDVLLQFLTEAVVICLVGGIFGIMLATGAAAAITSTGKFDVFITLQAVVVACGFSSLVGVFFGFYPRAGRLQAAAGRLPALRVMGDQ
jgi:putative ABC transport system permease protein